MAKSTLLLDPELNFFYAQDGISGDTQESTDEQYRVTKPDAHNRQFVQMTQIVLHIGTPKTGTTAIQNALVRHEDALPDRGIVFLKSGRHRAAHNDLSNAIARHGSDHRFSASLSEEIKHSQTTHPTATLLLSSEMFALLPPDRFKEALPQIAPMQKRVVIYLRRQDTYAEAFYKQRLKNGRISKPFSAFLDSDECRRITNYPDLLHSWKRSFPEADIVPRIYDREQFPNSNITCDFAQVLGLEETALQHSDGDTNTSPGTEAIMMMQALAPHFSSAERRRIFKSVKSMNIKGFLGKAHLFSPEERHQYLSRFEADNAQLREEYFPDQASVFPSIGPPQAAQSDTLTLSQRQAIVSAMADAALKLRS